MSLLVKNNKILTVEDKAIKVVKDTSTEDELVTRTITEYTNNRVSIIGMYAFDGCSSLRKVNFQNAIDVKYGAFTACELEELNIPKVETIRERAFFNAVLSNPIFPKVKTIETLSFGQCDSEMLDFYELTNIKGSAFQTMQKLKKLIIRTDSVCELKSTQAFQNVYNQEIYVPESLLNQYKMATNWASFADKIKPIYKIDLVGNGTIDKKNVNKETILKAIPNEGQYFIGWYDGVVVGQLVVGEVIEEATYNQLQVTYPLTLNENGYYQNSNQGKSSSYSIGRFNFNIEDETQILRIRYLQSSENSYDYGVVGTVDTALAQSTANTGYTTFKGVTTTTEKEVFVSDISVGEHFIDIKYIKDGSGDTGTDTLQVKVDVIKTNIERVVSGEFKTSKSEINIGIVDEKTMKPVSLVALFNNTPMTTIETLDVTMPTIAYGLGVASYENNIYTFGGAYYVYQGESYRLNDIYKIDTTTEIVTKLNVTLPKALSETCVAQVGKYIYILGGCFSNDTGYTNSVNTIYKFDTETEKIELLSATLPTCLYGCVCEAVGTDIYLIGGYDGSSWGTNNNKTSRIFKFDTITETAQMIEAKLPYNRASMSGAKVGTNIYLFGGYDAQSNSNATEDIVKFDTVNQTTTTLTEKFTRMTSPSVSEAGTNIYICGGINNGAQVLDTIYKFDTITETYELLDLKLPNTLHSASAITVNDNMYLIGGSIARNPNVLTDKIIKINNG